MKRVEPVYARKLDNIQNEVRGYLRGLGFVKRRRTFNRTLESGFVHVIRFQMGQYWGGFYGQFTLNLGVFIPEIFSVLTGAAIPDFVSESDCEISIRLGRLMTPPEDRWWSLESETAELSSEITTLLQRYGLPYLDRFRNAQHVLAEWQKFGFDIGLPPRGGLSMAVLLALQGEKKEAYPLLKAEVLRRRGTPYAEYVRSVGQKIGLTIPGDQLLDD